MSPDIFERRLLKKNYWTKVYEARVKGVSPREQEYPYIIKRTGNLNPTEFLGKPQAQIYRTLSDHSYLDTHIVPAVGAMEHHETNLRSGEEPVQIETIYPKVPGITLEKALQERESINEFLPYLLTFVHDTTEFFDLMHRQLCIQHNDLHDDQIIIHQLTERMVFLDFEFSGHFYGDRPGDLYWFFSTLLKFWLLNSELRTGPNFVNSIFENLGKNLDLNQKISQSKYAHLTTESERHFLDSFASEYPHLAFVHLYPQLVWLQQIREQQGESLYQELKPWLFAFQPEEDRQIQPSYPLNYHAVSQELGAILAPYISHQLENYRT